MDMLRYVIQDPAFIQLCKDVLLVLGFWVAYRGFRNATEQLRSNEMPFLKVVYRKTSDDITPSFFLQNVGKGVCHSISFEPFFLILTDVRIIWRLRLSLSGSNILAADDRDEIKLDLKVKELGSTNEEKSSTDLIRYFFQDRACALGIYFNNSLGRLFMMRMSVGHDAANLVSSPAEVTIGTMVIVFLRSMFTYIKVYAYLCYWWMEKYLVPRKGAEK